MKNKIIIVDENDQQIGLKERGTLNENDIYRVSALWVTNSQGDILLAQRSFNKKNNSGKWGQAVAGTVDEGESYFENIVKETEEEIGLTDVEFEEIKKIFRKKENKSSYFCQWYKSVVDKKLEEFKIQEEEVENIKWFKKEELEKELKNNPEKFLAGMREYLQMFSF